MPFEYCSYGPSPVKCAQLLLSQNPSLHAILYPPPSSSSSTSIDVAVVDGADAHNDNDANNNNTADENNDNDNTINDNNDEGGEDDAAPAAVKAPKKAKAKQVRIVTSQRQKRKHITTVTGLEAYNATKLPLVAKAFSKKFACQASATKDKDELLVQGDFGIEVAEALVADYGVKKSDIKIVQEKRA